MNIGEFVRKQECGSNRLGSDRHNLDARFANSQCSLYDCNLFFQFPKLMGQTAAPSYMQPLAREIRGRKYWDLFCAAVVGLSLALFALNSLADEETTPAQVEVDSFEGPVLLDQVTPEYPMNQLRAGEEAWVELYFMVDPDGKPYEVTAIDSIGHSSFRNAAIRAVKKWTYQPALYNGSNIDAGARFKVVFSIEKQSRGASDWFVRLQRGLRQAISENEKEQADEYLNTLETTRRLNLYEDAFFNFAKYEYMAKWGTEDQQLQALDRAIAHESLGTYLPTDVFVYALGKQLPLLLKKRDYQRAMVTNMNLESKMLAMKRDRDLIASGSRLKNYVKTKNPTTSLLLSTKCNLEYLPIQGRILVRRRSRSYRRAKVEMPTGQADIQVSAWSQVQNRRTLWRMLP